jgi:hypothetical protein
MVGVGDRGTDRGETNEARTDQVTEVGTSSSQIVAESGRAGAAGVRTILVVMGVSGSGKTTIAKALADRLGWAFEAAWRKDGVTRVVHAHRPTDASGGAGAGNNLAQPRESAAGGRAVGVAMSDRSYATMNKTSAITRRRVLELFGATSLPLALLRYGHAQQSRAFFAPRRPRNGFRWIRCACLNS